MPNKEELKAEIDTLELMEITEKERLMLVENKKLICGTAMEMLELSQDPEKNALEIKKKISMILSLLSTIAAYASVKNCNVDGFREVADDIFTSFDLPSKTEQLIKKLDPEMWKKNLGFQIGLFSNYANSVRFDFTKKNVKIHFPKISFNVGNITNK